MSTTCLETAIGLDRSECPCYGDVPDGIDNTSSTGYYMTDVQYGVPLRAGILSSAGCDETSIWATLNNIRAEAVRDMKLDLVAVLDSLKDSNYRRFEGSLGKADGRQKVAINSNYAGQILRPVMRKKHYKLVITHIYAGFSTTGTKTLTVRSNAIGWTNETVTLNTTADQWVENTLETALELPFYDPLAVELYYAFTYSGSGQTILSNDLYCCGRPTWGDLFTLAGVTTNNLDDLEDNKGRGSQGLGLVLRGRIECESLGWVCDLTSLGMTDTFKMIGLAILLKSTQKLIAQLTRTGVINEWTLLDADNWPVRMADAEMRYNELINLIARQLPTGVSGCYGCDKRGLRLTKI